MASVVRINITPVKGLGLRHPSDVELTTAGVMENRRFYLVSRDRGLLFNGRAAAHSCASGDREAIDFGVYFDIEQPGRVRLGDAVELV